MVWPPNSPRYQAPDNLCCHCCACQTNKQVSERQAQQEGNKIVEDQQQQAAGGNKQQSGDKPLTLPPPSWGPQPLLRWVVGLTGVCYQCTPLTVVCRVPLLPAVTTCVALLSAVTTFTQQEFEMDGLVDVLRSSHGAAAAAGGGGRRK